MRAIIVGGGIAGLSSAIALGQTGVSVDVYERSEEFTELGAGIQLGPNSFKALDLLGVSESLISRSVPVQRLMVRDGTDDSRLVTLDTDESYREEFTYPYVVAHRQDIQRCLLDRAQEIPAIRLHPGVHITGYVEAADHVSAVTDGEYPGGIEGDVLIGADGVRSKIRAQLLGDGPPPLCGHTIYRSVIDMSEAPGDVLDSHVHASGDGISVMLWAGTDWHAVCYPIAEGTKLNVVLTHADGRLEREVGVPVDGRDVASVPQGACTAVQNLLAAGREWRRWTLAERLPVDVWSSERVIVIGDAAHPMLQYAAQGAGMAVEDAVMLAESLAVAGPVDHRLQEFVDSRAPRTAAARNLAWELGRQVYHAEASSRRDRNHWLSTMTTPQLRDMARWLHGSQTFQETPDGSGHVSGRGSGHRSRTRVRAT